MGQRGSLVNGGEWREQGDPPLLGSRARVCTLWGRAIFFLLVFRGPCRALQDLYEDWSAIYRNRIPPYLTLPLVHPPLRLASAASGDSVLLPLPFFFLPSLVVQHGLIRYSRFSFFTKPLFSSLLFKPFAMLSLLPSSSASLVFILSLPRAASAQWILFSLLHQRTSRTKELEFRNVLVEKVPPKGPHRACFTRNYTKSRSCVPAVYQIARDRPRDVHHGACTRAPAICQCFASREQANACSGHYLGLELRARFARQIIVLNGSMSWSWGWVSKH